MCHVKFIFGKVSRSCPKIIACAGYIVFLYGLPEAISLPIMQRFVLKRGGIRTIVTGYMLVSNLGKYGTKRQKRANSKGYLTDESVFFLVRMEDSIIDVGSLYRDRGR